MLETMRQSLAMRLTNNVTDSFFFTEYSNFVISVNGLFNIQKQFLKFKCLLGKYIINNKKRLQIKYSLYATHMIYVTKFLNLTYSQIVISFFLSRK